MNTSAASASHGNADSPPLVAFVECSHCKGAGRVPTGDIDPLARQAWADAPEGRTPNTRAIYAIKLLRERSGLHLRDAKDAIDRVIASGGSHS